MEEESDGDRHRGRERINGGFRTLRGKQFIFSAMNLLFKTRSFGDRQGGCLKLVKLLPHKPEDLSSISRIYGYSPEINLSSTSVL